MHDGHPHAGGKRSGGRGGRGGLGGGGWGVEWFWGKLKGRWVKNFGLEKEVPSDTDEDMGLFLSLSLSLSLSF